MIKDDMKYYKKKRNNILFFIYAAIIFVIVVYWALNSLWQVDNNILTMIAIPGFIILIALMIGFRNKINYYNMQYQYYLMKYTGIGIQTIKKKLFTKTWLKKFEQDGFKLGTDAVKYRFLYRVSDKLTGISNRGKVLECIIIAKHEDFDFYGNDIDKEINQLHVMFNEKNEIKKIVVLQFKRYNEYNEKTELEIDKIINFSNQRYHLVHLTAGYFDQQDKVYFLCPKKRYPNKYYYYACLQMKKYCDLQ